MLFLVVWVVIAYLRAEVLRRQRRGLLPGQQPPGTDRYASVVTAPVTMRSEAMRRSGAR